MGKGNNLFLMTGRWRRRHWEREREQVKGKRELREDPGWWGTVWGSSQWTLSGWGWLRHILNWKKLMYNFNLLQVLTWHVKFFFLSCPSPHHKTPCKPYYCHKFLCEGRFCESWDIAHIRDQQSEVTWEYDPRRKSQKPREAMDNCRAWNWRSELKSSGSQGARRAKDLWTIGHLCIPSI